VRADALPGVTFSGRVRLLGLEADARTGTYLVEGEISDPRGPNGERLLPGMQGTMAIEIGAREALVVPKTALIQTPEGEGLYLVVGERAQFVQPKTGKVTTDQVEVISGVDPGDSVIVIGQHVLRDGDLVRKDPIRSETPSPKPAR
jgi:multidrug efflux pump subunit AcrA (membrane-fusion protein)